MDSSKLFSAQLEEWLKDKRPKTLSSLVEVFDEKSFAVGLLLLMFVPALPLPTGGVTHIFEVIAVLIAFGMVLGRKTVWIPKRWREKSLSRLSEREAFGKILRTLIWVERRSKPRLSHVIRNGIFLRITGILIIILCVTAFVAPPFSGLDTLPSLAVVFIALSIIFEDMVLYVLGVIAGVIGIGTVLVLGAALFKSIKLLF